MDGSWRTIDTKATQEDVEPARDEGLWPPW